MLPRLRPHHADLAPPTMEIAAWAGRPRLLPRLRPHHADLAPPTMEIAAWAGRPRLLPRLRRAVVVAGEATRNVPGWVCERQSGSLQLGAVVVAGEATRNVPGWVCERQSGSLQLGAVVVAVSGFLGLDATRSSRRRMMAVAQEQFPSPLGVFGSGCDAELAAPDDGGCSRAVSVPSRGFWVRPPRPAESTAATGAAGRYLWRLDPGLPVGRRDRPSPPPPPAPPAGTCGDWTPGYR